MNIFFILVEFVFASFAIASFSLDLIIPGILSVFLMVFITSFPDFLLEKAGKKPINRNIKFAVGALGFVLLCYLIPDRTIREVRQRQIDQIKEQQTEQQTEQETEPQTESRRIELEKYGVSPHC